MPLGLLHRDRVVSFNSRFETDPQSNGAATFQFIVAAQAGVTVTCFFYLSGGLKEDTTVPSSGEPTVSIWWLNSVSSRYASRHWSLYLQLDFTIVSAWAGHPGMSTFECSKLHLRSLHGRECIVFVTSVKLNKIAGCHAMSISSFWHVDIAKIAPYIVMKAWFFNCSWIYLFKYWFSTEWQVSIDAGDMIHFYNAPTSGTPQVFTIDQQSNINQPGKFCFEIDSVEIKGEPSFHLDL